MIPLATTTKEPKKKIRPAITPEAREQQLINLATNAAEEMLLNGTAPPSIIVHYLKLGSTRERMEQARLSKEVELAQAKTEALQSAKRMEDMYKEAMTMLREYTGQEEYIDEDVQ